MNPPRDDPLLYCRFCFSQFRVDPLHPNGQKNQQLVRQISSLIQIDLDPQQASDTALCAMCRQQLSEFQLFRDRCHHHHDSIVRSSVEAGDQSINDLWFAVETLEDDSDAEADGLTSKSDSLKKVPEAHAREAFWWAISRDVGVIPEHVQRVLELTGFCQNASLGMITPTTIKQIEQNMREAVEFVTSGEKSRGTSRADLLRQYYGSVYCKDPTNFKFFTGEVQTILSITAAVQENGISKYLSKLSVQKRMHQSQRNRLLGETPNDAEGLAEMLVQKIKDYYTQRASDSDEFKAFFARLPQIEHCDVRQTDDGAIFALVSCPYCGKTVQLWLEGNAWRDSNFVKHCQQHCWVDRNAPQAKKKRTDEG